MKLIINTLKKRQIAIIIVITIIAIIALIFINRTNHKGDDNLRAHDFKVIKNALNLEYDNSQNRYRPVVKGQFVDMLSVMTDENCANFNYVQRTIAMEMTYRELVSELQYKDKIQAGTYQKIADLFSKVIDIYYEIASDYSYEEDRIKKAYEYQEQLSETEFMYLMLLYGIELPDNSSNVKDTNINNDLYSNSNIDITPIEQAIKDGKLAERYLTEGMTEDDIINEFNYGRLKEYYTRWESAYIDASKIGLLKNNNKQDNNEEHNDILNMKTYIGFEGTDITEEMSNVYKIPRGIYVKNVVPNSPAEKAGLYPNDVITDFNGSRIYSMSELNSLKDEYLVGATVWMNVYRDNNYFTVYVKLEENPNI